MDTYERKLLTILFSTNKTLHEAKVSNQYRLNSITELNDDARQKMEDVSVGPLELPFQKIRNEIYNTLIFSSIEQKSSAKKKRPAVGLSYGILKS